jgi:hypothetical protein
VLLANLWDWLATGIIALGTLSNLYRAIDREDFREAAWSVGLGVVVLVAVWR